MENYLQYDTNEMNFLFAILINRIVATFSKGNLQDEIQSTACGRERLTADVSCHYTKIPDDIPDIEEDYHVISNSIFFVETSCGGGLNFRQACSIEAAAIANPDKHIYVLFAGPVSKFCLVTSPLAEVLSLKNVYLYRVFIAKYLRNTPFEVLAENLNGSSMSVYYTSNVLKYVTLNRYGGIYMDLDVMAAKPFDLLHEQYNFAGRQDNQSLSAAVLALTNFGIGKQISISVLKTLKMSFQSGSRKYNDADVLFEVLQKLCNTGDVTEMAAVNCQGFEVYDSFYFYPIKPEDWSSYFEAAPSGVRHQFWSQYIKSAPTSKSFTEPFAFHLWNFFSNSQTIYQDSFYALLIMNFCPSINKIMY